MNSTLYSSRTIETKYFLLSNLRIKRKFGGFVRTQEFGCSNYYGEEIKNPIYETTIKPTIISFRNSIKPINLFNSKNKERPVNKSVSSKECNRLILKSKNNKGLQAIFHNNYSSKRIKNNVNIIKMNFPYCKPTVKNSFTELIVYNKNRDYIIAKNIERKKKFINKHNIF